MNFPFPKIHNLRLIRIKDFIISKLYLFVYALVINKDNKQSIYLVKEIV